jgi:outer membrane protein assembly factor BamB
VGYAQNALLVGSSEGEVIKLDVDDGTVLWTSALHGEVLAAPQGNGKVVVAQTYDGN